MYFPKGFSMDIAIELANLLVQAVNQLEAFKEGKPWTLPDSYTLLAELHYPTALVRMNRNGNKHPAQEIKSLPHAARRGNAQIPMGFIAKRKNNCFVILRGTITIREWIQNMQLNFVPYLLPNFGKVHAGLLDLYNSLRDEIRTVLLAAKQYNKVFISGHSSGGALATLALPDISNELDLDKIALYSFGCPRVGDNDFVEAFDRKFSERAFRIVNTSDVICSFPLPVPFAGFIGGYFSHVATPVDFTVQKNDLDKNHNIELYLEALKEAK
jgi:triacylglycerol lipase